MQLTKRADRNPFRFTTRCPVPSHLWHLPVPMQYGQTTAMSCTLAAESSDADRSDLSREIAVGCSSAPEQDASTLALPEGFYAFRSARVAVDAGWARNLFLARRFARHVSPLRTTVYTHPGDEELYKEIRHLSC